MEDIFSEGILEEMSNYMDAHTHLSFALTCMPIYHKLHRITVRKKEIYVQTIVKTYTKKEIRTFDENKYYDWKFQFITNYFATHFSREEMTALLYPMFIFLFQNHDGKDEHHSSSNIDQEDFFGFLAKKEDDEIRKKMEIFVNECETKEYMSSFLHTFPYYKLLSFKTIIQNSQLRRLNSEEFIQSLMEKVTRIANIATLNQ